MTSFFIRFSVKKSFLNNSRNPPLFVVVFVQNVGFEFANFVSIEEDLLHLSLFRVAIYSENSITTQYL